MSDGEKKTRGPVKQVSHMVVTYDSCDSRAYRTSARMKKNAFVHPYALTPFSDTYVVRAGRAGSFEYKIVQRTDTDHHTYLRYNRYGTADLVCTGADIDFVGMKGGMRRWEAFRPENMEINDFRVGNSNVCQNYFVGNKEIGYVVHSSGSTNSLWFSQDKSTGMLKAFVAQRGLYIPPEEVDRFRHPLNALKEMMDKLYKAGQVILGGDCTKHCPDCTATDYNPIHVSTHLFGEPEEFPMNLVEHAVKRAHHPSTLLDKVMPWVHLLTKRNVNIYGKQMEKLDRLANYISRSNNRSLKIDWDAASEEDRIEMLESMALNGGPGVDVKSYVIQDVWPAYFAELFLRSCNLSTFCYL